MIRGAFMTLALVAAVNAACKDQTEENSCMSDESCTVGTYLPFSCRSKGCFDLFAEEDCNANNKCEYTMIEGAGYSQCFAKPDDKPCNDASHNNGNCPAKCTFSYDDASCRDTECTDIQLFGEDIDATNNACVKLNKNCNVFKSEFQTQCTAARGPECAQFFEEVDCKKMSYCDYAEGNVCFEPNDLSKFNCMLNFDLTPAVAKAACGKFSVCKWSDIQETCRRSDVEESCKDLWSCDMCSQKSGCTWSADQFQCSEGSAKFTCYDDASTSSSSTTDGNGGNSDGPCADRGANGCQQTCTAVYSPQGDFKSCRDAACNELYVETDCKAKECDYDPDTYQCFPKDNNKACSTQTRESCPQRCYQDIDGCRDRKCSDNFDIDRCAADDTCRYHALSPDVSVCIGNTEAVTCAMVSDNVFLGGDSACARVDGCEWSVAASFCVDKGATVPCSAYRFDQTKCMESNCVFVSDSSNGCLEKGEAIKCTDVYSAAACNPLPGCVFQNFACKACSGTACDDADTTTTQEPTTTTQAVTLPADTVCSDIQSIDGCVTPCAYDFVQSKCRGKQCVDGRSKEDCIGISKNCEYLEDTFQCTKKDTNADCNSYAYNACPLARCVQDIPNGDNTKATCRDRTCDDNFDGASCASFSNQCAYKDGYCWKGDVNKPPCRILQSDECNASSYCENNEITSSCVEKGALLACSRLTGTTAGNDRCATRVDCTFLESGSFSICYEAADSVPCPQIWDESVCMAEDSCYFNAISGVCRTCKDKADCEDVKTTQPPIDTTPCPELTATDCENSAICKVDFETDKCVSYTCFDPVASEEACDFIGCSWDPSGFCKQSDDGKPCDTYTKWDDCSAATGRCSAEFNDDASITCRKAICEDLFEAVCLDNVGMGLNCRWSDLGFCGPKGGKDICERIYDETDCGTSKDCEYKLGVCVELGAKVPCKSIPEEGDCDEGCKWWATEFGGTCQDTDATAPCSLLGSEDLCPKTDCQWFGEAAVCGEKGVELKCSQLYEFGSCFKQPGCNWNQQDYTCSDCTGRRCETTLADCSTFGSIDECPFSYCTIVGDNCVAQACSERQKTICDVVDDTCEFDATFKICKEKGGKVSCSDLTELSSCGALDGCTWLLGSFRCLAEGDELACFDYYSGDECPTDRCSWNDNGFCESKTTSSSTTTSTASQTSPSTTSTTTPPPPPPPPPLDGTTTKCDSKKLGPCDLCDTANTKCLRCRSDRYLYEKEGVMRCNTQVTCEGSTFAEMAMGLEWSGKCNCKSDANLGGDCFRCTFKGGSLKSSEATKTCVRCKNAKYLNLAGVCGGENGCEGGTFATMPGNYGRRCQPAFTCFKNKNQQFTSALKQKGAALSCKCSPGTLKCAWGADGETALACKSSKFLFDGKCLDSCPSGTAPYGVSAYKRFCANKAFTCNNKKIVGGAAAIGVPQDSSVCKCQRSCASKTCTHAVDGPSDTWGVCQKK